MVDRCSEIVKFQTQKRRREGVHILVARMVNFQAGEGGWKLGIRVGIARYTKSGEVV